MKRALDWAPDWALTALARAALAAVAFLALSNHVGSPNVYFDGDAGPYPVRVVVRPPVVIPGLAEISVRLRQEGASPPPAPRRVTVQPVIWTAGKDGAPPADVAKPVPGDPGLWSAQLWMMTASSYSIRVEMEGTAGRGTAIVPVATARLARLGMQRSLGVVLAILGAFLLIGGLTVVGAAVRESTLPPGAEPDPARRAKARAAVAVAALLFALALWGGRAWWNDVDAEYRGRLYRPYHATARVAAGPESGRVLDLAIDDERWRGEGRLPLLPDHGKLMHLFLVRLPGEDAFAHVHPLPRRPGGDGEFRATLPPLPAGRYALYADVTQESGFPDTLAAEIELPAPEAAPGRSEAPAPDPDDSWLAPAPAAGGPGATAALGDGYTMTWEPAGGNGRLLAGRDLDLQFTVRGPDGRPAALEPYLGMLAHAVIRKDDGAVFVHLHPQGTVSMAAQQVFAWREARAAAGLPVVVAAEPPAAAPGYRRPTPLKPAAMPSMPAMAMSMPAASTDGAIRLPYGFPKPGSYRLWVQVRAGGKVRTGVFAAPVAPS